jgi:hypothetical protein
MQQLTKPEIIQGELIVKVQLTNQNVKNIHEALLLYLQLHTADTRKSTYQEIKALREEMLKLLRIMNPS